MKMAKSYKIILLITAFVLCIVVAIGTMSFKDTKAVSTTSAESYFTGASSVEFKDNAVVAGLKNGETLLFKNKLVINDFALEFSVDAKISSLTFEFDTDSFYVNGNKNADGKFDKKISQELVLGKEKSTLNGKDVSARLSNDNTVKISVEDNFVKVNGESVDAGAYYKVKEINGITAASISVKATVDGEDAGKLSIKSISQKSGDDNFKQTFEVKDGKVESAYPRVALNDSFYTRTEDGYEAIKNVATKYDLTFNTYSLFNEVTASSVYLAKEEGQNIWFETDTKLPNSLQFNEEGNAEFNIVSKKDSVEKIYETVEVKVVNYDDDKDAPMFRLDDTLAYEAFNATVNENIRKGEHFVHLGSDFEIPSMEDIVYDNFVPYNELEYTVYYSTDSAKNKTASKMKFQLSEAGEYYFFIVYSDDAGNSLDKDEDFVKEIEDADGNGTGEYTFAKYVFKFSIDDDAPIIVTPAVKQGEGYVGATYTASKFTIDASGCTTTYKLFYNADSNATAESAGWIEIPKASSIQTEEDVPESTKNHFDYDAIKAISYSGNLTFTPDRVGAYMIECTATSSVSARYESANSAIIKVVEPATVKPHNPWLEENVWSVVFLSLGTICLIGIIVLLCIKPKDETESD